MGLFTLNANLIPGGCIFLPLALLFTATLTAQNPDQLTGYSFGDQSPIVQNGLVDSAVSINLSDYRMSSYPGYSSPQCGYNTCRNCAQPGWNGRSPRTMRMNGRGTVQGSTWTLPTGRRYLYGNRYYGPINNRYYGPQYGNF